MKAFGKLLLKILLLYLITGMIYTGILMVSGLTEMDLGMGLLGNLIVAAYFTLFWPFVILWQMDGLNWVEYLSFGIFIALTILVIAQFIHQKRYQNHMSNEY